MLAGPVPPPGRRILPEVEAAVFVARVGDLLAAVAFRQHDLARAVRLQQINVESMRPAVVGPREPEA